MYLGYNWEALEPGDFELLCAELLTLEGFVNVVPRGGSHDEGIDIAADLPRRQLGKEILEHWHVQCKHSPRSSFGKPDIERYLSWADVHRPDVLAIFTSGTITPQLDRYLHDHRERSSHTFAVQVWQRFDIEQLVQYHKPRAMQALSVPQSDAGPSSARTLADLDDLLAELLTSNVEPTVVLRQEANVFREAASANPAISQRLTKICIREQHPCVYAPDGATRTTHAVTLFNAGIEPVASDTFKIFGEYPVETQNDLKLATSNVHNVEYEQDTPTSKKLRLYLASPILPLKSGSYSFAYDWPLVGGLAGTRYYAVAGTRFRADVIVEQRLPSSWHVNGVLLLRQASRSVDRLKPDLTTDGADQVLSFQERNLRASEVLSLSFIVAEPLP